MGCIYLAMKPTAETDSAKLGSELQNPILDIAASFWEPERYRAFRICYASMRRIDDLVDNLREHGLVDDIAQVTAVSNQLSTETLLAIAGEGELAETIQRFAIPVGSWLRLVEAMRFDLENDRFATFMQFRRYTRGAAIAPAAVFIHLISVIDDGAQEEKRNWRAAPIDPFDSARDMALFSYLTHILRDFRKDHNAGLDYFALDSQERFGVTEDICNQAAAGSQVQEFSDLVRFYHSLAQRYQQRATIEQLPVFAHLTERYKFSLALIWRLYSQILDKIEAADFELDPRLIHPSKEEIVSEIELVAQERALDKEILKAGLSRLDV